MIQRLFENACKIPSDINQHLPILSDLSTDCSHITEMGVRSMVSSWAFLNGLRRKKGKLVSIDIVDPIQYGISTEVVSKNCLNEGIEFQFILADSLKIDIEPTDFLFIDTDHTKEQLTKELERHASKVRKYIGFHDTESCKEELQPVINDFLEKNKDWKKLIEYTVNNGIIIIKKQ